MPTRAALLMLVDGRLPAGGHAHSSGVECFVRRNELRDISDLASYLNARLETIGFVDGTIAAAAVLEAPMTEREWTDLDAEAGARMASPALRTTSRTLGRQLARTTARMWPSPTIDMVRRVHRDGPHQSTALGATAVAARLDATDAAQAALYGAVAAPATAAVRLLGLDPVDAHGLLAQLGPRIDVLAAAAVRCVQTDGLRNAPAPAALRSELAAEEHAHQEVRLFAS